MKKWWMWLIQSGIWALVLFVHIVGKRSKVVIYYYLFVVCLFAVLGVIQYLCEKQGEKGKKIFQKITRGIVICLVVCLIPIPTGVYEDGGTKAYTALTYKIVDWHRLTEDSTYDTTRMYFIPDHFKSIDELWFYEVDKVEHSFVARVLEVYDTSVIVEPVEGESEDRISDKVSVSTKNLEDIGVNAGSLVRITYIGGVMETYPVQIRERSWELLEEAK